MKTYWNNMHVWEWLVTIAIISGLISVAILY